MERGTPTVRRIAGTRIKAAREARGYSREDFAYLMDISYTRHVVDAENGVRPLSLAWVVRAALVLGVSVDYLVGNADLEKPTVHTWDVARVADKWTVVYTDKDGIHVVTVAGGPLLFSSRVAAGAAIRDLAGQYVSAALAANDEEGSDG